MEINNPSISTTTEMQSINIKRSLSRQVLVNCCSRGVDDGDHPMLSHYDDVTMNLMASQITSLTIVYSAVYSGGDQRKHQSSASLAFVWGIHRDRWIPRTKGQLRGKCFHLMTSSWHFWLQVVALSTPGVSWRCWEPGKTHTCHVIRASWRLRLTALRLFVQ